VLLLLPVVWSPMLVATVSRPGRFVCQGQQGQRDNDDEYIIRVVRCDTAVENLACVQNGGRRDVRIIRVVHKQVSVSNDLSVFPDIRCKCVYLDVTYVSHKYCRCFIWLLYMFVIVFQVFLLVF
jgi:hypothetical protein